MKKLTLVVTMFISSLICALGQDTIRIVTPIYDAIKIDNDKKIIYPDKLNFTASISAYSVLKLLPEMFGRITDADLGNYEIKVEGVSVESFRETALNCILIGDIDKIEVKEDPVSSYKTGMSGSIDIKLKNPTDKVSGSVNLIGATPLSLAPFAITTLKKGKTDFKILASFQYNDDNRKYTEKQVYKRQNDELTEQSELGTNPLSWSEMVRTHFRYQPTDNQLLKVCLSEMYTSSRNIYDTYNTIDDRELTSYYSGTNRNFRILANTEYECTFKDRSKLDVEVNYNYSPLKIGYDKENIDLRYTNNMHKLGGKAEYAIQLLPAESKNSVKLFVASNYNFNFSNDVSTFSHDVVDLNFDIKTNYYDVSPYLQVECKLGKFALKATADSRNYRYDISLEDYAKYNETNSYVTGKLMAAYNFNPKHTLRFIGDRKLKIPASKQIYPFLTYSSANDYFVLGNPSLRPATTTEFKLEYLTNQQWGKSSSLMITFGVSYYNTYDLIRIKKGEKILGFPYEYKTFENDGTNNALSSDLMLNYRHGILTMGLTGDIYFNHEEYKSYENYYTNFNTSLVYALNFGKGWALAGDFSYYSRAEKADETLGSCLATSIQVAKSWKRYLLSAYFSTPLNGRVENRSYSTDSYTCQNSYLVYPSAGFVFRFVF